jgi:hypothetical protein
MSTRRAAAARAALVEPVIVNLQGWDVMKRRTTIVVNAG